MLNFLFRHHMSHIKGAKLSVLICIFLHRNARNRAWPSHETICKETGYTSAPVTQAIDWLTNEVHAIDLVPHEMRLEEEESLPKNKYIYQLNGGMILDGNFVPYMYLPDDLLLETKTRLFQKLKLLETKTKVIQSSSSSTIQDTTDTSTEVDEEKSDPPKQKKGKDQKTEKPINPVFDAIVEHIFQIKPENIQNQNAGARIGMIYSWLSAKKSKFKNREDVGMLPASAKPEHIKAFADDWKAGKVPGIQKGTAMVKDIEKFSEHWRSWASQKASITTPPSQNNGKVDKSRFTPRPLQEKMEAESNGRE